MRHGNVLSILRKMDYEMNRPNQMPLISQRIREHKITMEVSWDRYQKLYLVIVQEGGVNLNKLDAERIPMARGEDLMDTMAAALDLFENLKKEKK